MADAKVQNGNGMLMAVVRNVGAEVGGDATSDSARTALVFRMESNGLTHVEIRRDGVTVETLDIGGE